MTAYAAKGDSDNSLGQVDNGPDVGHSRQSVSKVNNSISRLRPLTGGWYSV